MKILHRLLSFFLSIFLSNRTIGFIKFDILRLRARILTRLRKKSFKNFKLHLGCGARRVPGWLNVDVAGSECDVDLAAGTLPWESATVETVVTQHVIEHLDLLDELHPLLCEIKRIMKPHAEIWLSCPDLEKICRAYVKDKGMTLVTDKLSRFPDGIASRYFISNKVPSQQIINLLFNQNGEHKNLFDLEFLTWVLQRAGFTNCSEVNERDFLKKFPEFPARNDEQQTLYVKAIA